MTTTIDEATAAAKRILAYVWDRLEGGIPIDPARIAVALGIDVFDADLGSGVAGALMKKQGEDPTILLNSADSANRQRFTCAHEIGHFVRRGETPDEFEFIDKRDKMATAGTDEDEIYANNFAAELLMPEETVKKFVKQNVSVLEMATRFGVSRDAMRFRLQNLGFAERVAAV